ncbi:MAG: hypothetical protein ACRC3J_05680 [Culicoidibacterales bacterium]
MAEVILSGVNKHGVSSDTLSENFATNHQIMLRGHQSNAGGMCLASINGVTLNPSNIRGLNVINISVSGKILAATTFYFGTVGHDANFVSWIKARTEGLVLMLSHTSNRSTRNLDNWMDTVGNRIWRNYWRTGAESEFSSFVGVYDVALKKFTSKQYMGSDKDDKPAEMMIVLDAIANIGVTGYGEPIAYDTLEYLDSQSAFEFKHWHDKALITDLHLLVGENIHLSAELWKDAFAQHASEGCVFGIKFFDKDQTVLSVKELTKDSDAFIWTEVRADIEIPKNAVYVSLYAAHAQSATPVGSVGIRNIVACTSRVVPTGNVDIQTFKTARLREISGNEIIASTGEPDLNALHYSAIQHVSSPDFSESTITTPSWENTKTFEFNQDIIWDYSDIVLMQSGGPDISHGLDKSNIGMYQHVFVYGDDVTKYPLDNLTYSDSVNYRTVVTPTTIKHYVNSILLGTKEITQHPTELRLEIGGVNKASIAGTVLEMCIIDKMHNTRIYELVHASIPNDSKREVIGRSQIAKTPTTETVSGAGASISTKVGSAAFPCGLTNNDIVYATVTSFGSATPVAELNKRYKCVVENDELIPECGAWISAGDTSELTIVAEYTPNPDINGVFDKPKYKHNKKLTFNAAFKIPDWKVQSDDVGTINMKFVAEVGTLIDGSKSGSISSRVEIDSNMRLKVTDCKILMLDNDLYTNQVLVKGVTYNLVIGIAGDKIVNTIGARYDNSNVYAGRIWDIDFNTLSKASKVSYSNKFESIHDFMLFGVPAFRSGWKCYENFKSSDWECKNFEAIGRYSFKSIGGDAIIKSNVGIVKRCRITFDIKAPEGKTVQILVGSNVIRSMSHIGDGGRMVGIVTSENSGEVSIKLLNSDVNDYLTINSLDVCTDVLDGISLSNKGAAIEQDFKDTQQPIHRRWLPDMRSNRLNYDWHTIGYFYICLDLILESGYRPILGGSGSRKFEMDLFDNKLRLYTVINGVTSDVVELPYDESLIGKRVKITACSFVKDSGLDTRRNVVSLKINKTEKICENWNGCVEATSNFIGYSDINKTYGGLDVFSYQLSSMTGDMNYRSTNIFTPLVYKVVAPEITFLKKTGESLFKLYMLGEEGSIGWVYNKDPKLEVGRLRDSHFVNNAKLVRVGQSNLAGFSMDFAFENGATPFDELQIHLHDYNDDANSVRGYNVGTYIAHRNNRAYRIFDDQNVDKWFDSSSTKSFTVVEAGASTRATFQTKPTWKQV